MSDFFAKEKHARERDELPHPIWRGIGLAMVVFVPIMSFALAQLIVDYIKKKGWVIPAEFRAEPVDIPLFGSVADIWAVIVVTFALILLIFSLFTIINASVYQASGNQTMRIFESEPQRYKKKRKLKKPKK